MWIYHIAYQFKVLQYSLLGFEIEGTLKCRAFVVLPAPDEI
jgi:hypothetical protein